MSALVLEASRTRVLVQDAGRPGRARIGVGRAGAADRGALALAHRLVGNGPGAAGLEVLLGGVVLRADGPVALAITGAPGPCDVDGRPVGTHAPLHLPAGARLRLGPAAHGLRTYVVPRGGVDVPAVLGSRSTDTLSGLGPAPLPVGARLPVGADAGPWPGVDAAPPPRPTAEVMGLPVLAGPRAAHLTPAALRTLHAATWTVSARSDRIGVRLEGPTLHRAEGAPALPSEGTVHGAVQVPPDGAPLLFGVDHPLTGGYPVVAVVAHRALDVLGQLRPGQRLRLLRLD